MWPLRVLVLCAFLLMSTHAFEVFYPQWPYYENKRTVSNYFDEERDPSPMVKRQVIEVKRREAIARARCFFNPITC